MEYFGEYIIPWSISNIIAIIFLISAAKKTKLARLFFVLLFTWACWINYTTSHNDPEVYLFYAALTPFDLYRDFINGWFKSNITLMVTLISIGQGFISIGMILKGWIVRLACIGAIIFFMAIAPLGIGSAFPFSLFTIAALYFILRKDDMDYLWNYKP